ncbi:MAG: hypothetical protein COU28_02370 [Candidatus Magasanikbacteria bacterium CG10_big_fil_rev_8_21_14_0_10_36_16]|uniref:N-acetyltransferase domain-containing protein n=1 Tax=Candidatus Magasanikbacteria bacterium CG10_big_fil_rev_8_21_14_0_10_36_16 TaxID=1974645 RepID=A0A2H0TYK3_9BACT|nr:MAG: hypothetical protein COU28_02370 [Candidatus Magasanikbacteria bacterium CG10_big_fil_rev_8_21_14_0_10_36_16]
MKLDIYGYEINTRNCQLTDKKFILDLYQKTLFKYVAKYYKPSIEMFSERFYSDYKERKILLRGKRRIGLFQLSKKENKLLITGLFLSPSYQKKGIGKFLMNYFEDNAKKNKLETIELSVWDNNPAKDFYKKCGYKIESKKKHKYLMTKNIK